MVSPAPLHYAASKDGVAGNQLLLEVMKKWA
jgi:hypothetical protein